MAKKKNGKKNGTGGRTGLVFGAILMLALAAAGWLYFQPKEVLVPAVVGFTTEEATQKLRAVGLQFQLEERDATTPQEKAGEVMIQYPEASTPVPRGSVVTLVVVAEEEGLPVPDLAGRTRSEAEDDLRRLGFTVDFRERKVDDVPIGRVVEQTPLAGDKLAPGGLVVLVISGGRGDQEVPDLLELPLELAREMLEELGLEVSVQRVARADFYEGDPLLVLRQDPEPGVKLPVGSRVVLTVPTELPPVDENEHTGYHAPRVEGLTVAEARRQLEDEGIALELVEPAGEDSVITFQDPPPGDPLSGETPTVRARVAASAVVPSLTGIGENEARARLRQAQLTVGGVTYGYGPVAGEVIGQRPTSGIEVVAGSGVDLVIADPDLSSSAAVDPPLPTPAFTPAPWVD